MNGVSFNDRNGLWAEMESGAAAEWDVVVIGGGITGAGVLREAVRRGYRSLLVEQRDFAWGTSSRSSKMVHGGLRYLASGNVSLTRHALRERERLLEEAPGLVERLGYYYPLYKKVFPPRFAAAILFWLYDRIAGISDHRPVSNAELLQIFPGISTADLNGAFYYTDAVTDDTRLTLRVLHESVGAGGHVCNYVKATGLETGIGRGCDVTLQDVESGRELTVNAAVVVNATGAWADRLRRLPLSRHEIRPQRGSHIVLPAEIFPAPSAIFLLQPSDGRRIFVYPWEGRTVIGTTDIPHPDDLDIAASITAAELDYLLSAAGRLYPERPPAADDVISTWSGVRPIIAKGRTGKPSKAERNHHVWVEGRVLTCSGGKLTTFRHMAVDVLSKAEPLLPPGRTFSSDRVFAPAAIEAGEIFPGDPGRGERLLGRYGRQAREMMAEAGEAERRPIGETGYCLAELKWCLQNESVVHLDDLMLRRTRLGLLLRDGGAAILGDIRETVQNVTGWDELRWTFEKERYLGVIDRFYSVPTAETGSSSR